jgi:hypothetical protein
MARVFDLDFEVVAVVPRISRRVRVPAAASLPDVHHVIQAVMGGEDRHLHLFEIAGREYGVPPDEDWERDAWDGVDEATLKLSEALAEGTGAFEYVYDFGSEWRVTVRASGDHVIPGAPAAECLAGERAAPPEDSGGPEAYQAFVENATARQGGTRDDGSKVPRRFDPAFFDLAAANERLRRTESVERDEGGQPGLADASERLIADITLLALDLGAWEESSGRRTAWKTLRFEVLDVLQREGLIETTPARKSVVITEQGIQRARRLRQRLQPVLDAGDPRTRP